MITVHFLRHAEPDYSCVVLDRNRFAGNRRDFAPLSEMGRRQAVEVARKLRGRTGVELVLSSPYTRALETAATVASELRLPLRVVPELHDWLAVIDGHQPIDGAVVDAAITRYLQSDFADAEFETPEELEDRMHAVVKGLVAGGTSEAIIVGHQEPICRITGRTEVRMGEFVTRVFEA